MRYRVVLVLAGSLVLAAASSRAALAAPVLPVFHAEAAEVADRVTAELRALVDRLEQHLGGGPGAARLGDLHRHPGRPDTGAPMAPWSPAERPLISLALLHRQPLGLTPGQVERLEALRDEFGREAIRREAEARLAELDLETILRREPVDLAAADVKMREAALAQAGLRMARLRTLEQGKAVLTAEQRARLDDILRGARPERTGGRRAEEAPAPLAGRAATGL